MKQSDLKALIRECLQEILEEGDKVCAWCNKHLGSDPQINGTSHGICPDCMKGEMEKLKGGSSHAPADPRSTLRQPDPDMSHYMGDMDRT